MSRNYFSNKIKLFQQEKYIICKDKLLKRRHGLFTKIQIQRTSKELAITETISNLSSGNMKFEKFNIKQCEASK